MLQLLLKPLLGVAGQAVSGFMETKNLDNMTFKEFVVEMQKMNKLSAKVGKVRVKTGGKK